MEDTHARLKDCKMGGATFDEALNELMNSVPVEVVAGRVIREHYERMRTRGGRSRREVLSEG